MGFSRISTSGFYHRYKAAFFRTPVFVKQNHFNPSHNLGVVYTPPSRLLSFIYSKNTYATQMKFAQVSNI